MDNLIHADCLDAMAAMAAESIDAIVTDPPYGLEFMGKEWDKLRNPSAHPLNQKKGMNHGEPEKGNPWASERSSYGAPKKMPRCRNCGGYPFSGSKKCECAKPDWDTRTREYARTMQDWHEAWAREAFRIAKPGAHLLAFGGTRTVHRLAAAIEDAGWEIRDMLVWGYASGFPKSLDVAKAIDKKDGRWQSPNAGKYGGDGKGTGGRPGNVERTADFDVELESDEAKKWNGWGTALKPAWEPIVMARKPLRGTVAANVLRHGTGALNIDGTRIALNGDEDMDATQAPSRSTFSAAAKDWTTSTYKAAGRWPSNVILTDPIFDGGVEGVVGGGETGPAGTAVNRNRPLDRSQYEATGYEIRLGPGPDQTYGDSGTYSRFFELPQGGLCEWCGASIAGPSSSPPSQPGASAPSVAATSPGGIWDSTVPEAESPTASDTNGTDPKSSPEPRPATTSPSGQPASPAEPSPISTGTTTTTRMRGLCGPCAERATTENTPPPDRPSDSGPQPVEPGSTRFLLVPKSARSEREPVLGGLAEFAGADPMAGHRGRRMEGDVKVRPDGKVSQPRANVHPTVKPLDLMRHLVRLVTPPGGTCLDPFLGSGTTALACEMEGFAWIGIEKEAEYIAITEARLNGTQRGLGLGA